jgi:hypothetical protein
MLSAAWLVGSAHVPGKTCTHKLQTRFGAWPICTALPAPYPHLTIATSQEHEPSSSCCVLLSSGSERR